MTDRVSKIQSLPEAASRPNLAEYLATQSECSVAEAQAVLRAAPVERTNDNADSADEVLAVCRRIRLKGFGAGK